jgi:hypothetical protein
MAAHEITPEENTSIMPVACALTAADLAAQAGRWAQFAAQAMTGRAETAHGLRLSFRPEPGAESELRELVAVENQCCPWAEWTVEMSAEQIVLDVRSAGEGIATLHTMFTGLRPSADQGPARRTAARAQHLPM